MYGARPTQTLTGRPHTPGVTTPWMSIIRPTARQPAASNTTPGWRTRLAARAATTATISAHRAVDDVMNRWKYSENNSASVPGTSRKRTNRPAGAPISVP